MALQLRITDRSGRERVVNVQPGDTVELAPGERATLVNTGDAVQATMERVGNDLVVHLGEGQDITITGYFAPVPQAAMARSMEVPTDAGLVQIPSTQESLNTSLTLPKSESGAPTNDDSLPENLAAGQAARSMSATSTGQTSATGSGTGQSSAGSSQAPEGTSQADANEIFAGSLETAPSTFSVAAASGREGTSVVFTITRSANLRGTDTVDYLTRIAGDDSAGATDFTSVSGTLTFLPGESVKTVVVDHAQDAQTAEGAETYTFELGNATTSRVGGETAFDPASAKGTIVNNVPPSAQNDAVAVGENGVLAASVFADNGNGPDSSNDAGDIIRVTAVQGQPAGVGVPVTLASGARVTLNADGQLSYDPAGKFESLGAGATQVDTFAYTITDDGNASATATVTVTIQGANDAPVAIDDTAATAQANVLNVAAAGLLVNDTDVDAGTVLTATLSGGGTSALGATVTVNPDGSYTYDGTAAAKLVALASGESIVDSFDYVLSDGAGGSDVGTVRITVTGGNDGPTADADAVAIGEDAPATDVTATLLAGDTDPDAGDVLRVSAVDTTGTTGVVTLANAGAANATVKYSPAGNFEALAAGENATDTFQYTVSDGNGGTSSATVTVTITGANDAPVLTPAAPTAGSTDENTATAGIAVTSFLGASVADVDNGAVQGIAIRAAAGNGTWEFSPDGGGSFNPIGAVSDAQALLLRATDLVRYIPDSANGETATLG
ncbi:MAG: Ig-like domain-containing protein, partial [Gammaproteobacteria bacterium]